MSHEQSLISSVITSPICRANFYDLRVPEVMEQQAELARANGIYGFCYYYWFNGRRLLSVRLDQMLKSGKPDFPFCICWANENWSRRWDGSEQEILVEQVYSDEAIEQHLGCD